MKWVNALSADACRDLLADVTRMNPRMMRSYLMAAIDCRLSGGVSERGRNLQEALMAGPKFLRETVLPRLGDQGFDIIDGRLQHPEIESAAGEAERRSIAGRTGAEARHRRSHLSVVPNDGTAGAGSATGMRTAAESHAESDADRMQTAAGSQPENAAMDSPAAAESQPDRSAAAVASQAPALARGHTLSLPESSSPDTEVHTSSESVERGARGDAAPAPDAANGMRSVANRRPIASGSQAGKPRLHALPADWQPGDGLRQYAAEHGIDAERIVAELRDASAGKGRRSHDWGADFRQFVRAAGDRQRQTPLPPMGMPPAAPAVAEADKPLNDRLGRLWQAYSRDRSGPMPPTLDTYKTGLAAAEELSTRWLVAMEVWYRQGRPAAARPPDFNRVVAGGIEEQLEAAEAELAAITEQRSA